MAQTVIPIEIKYGYQCFYRCDQCHKNVYENYQWLGSTFLLDQIIQDESKCPYCKADIDFDLSSVYKPTDITPGILRFPSKDYAFVFKTDQSILTTVNITVNGAINEAFEVNWGDGNKTIIILTGINQLLSHNYNKQVDYYIKIFCKKNILTYFRCHSSKLTLYMPTPSTQINLAKFELQNNNLTGTIPSLSGMTKLNNMYLYSNNLSGTIPSLVDMVKSIYIALHDNNLSGVFPSLSSLTVLFYLSFQNNQISGSIPSLTANVKLIFILCQYNNLTGSIPSLSTNVLLTQIRCNNNQISGTTPSLTNNIKLEKFYTWDNVITNYTASVLSITLTNFRMQNNLLPTSAVNQILADFVTNLGARPVNGKIYLHGTGNQAPTGQGIVDKTTLIAYGWTVLTN